jgi:large subunit ribosomal protein L17
MGYRKLGRRASHRRAMLRNLTTDFLKHERIETTETRAKEVRKLAEKMITLGKKGDLHSRRQAASYLFDKEVVAKVFEDIAPRYEDVSGGYTRIIKGNQRRGDATPMAIIELV